MEKPGNAADLEYGVPGFYEVLRVVAAGGGRRVLTEL